MQQTFTQEDLIRYVYGETSPEEFSAISKALDSDFDLFNEYVILKKSLELLDQLRMEPNETSVNIIMEYAQSHHEAH